MPHQAAAAAAAQTAKIGHGDRNQRIDTGSKIQGHASHKDPEQGPEHGPTEERPHSGGSGFKHLPGRTGYGQTFFLPGRVAQRVAINVFISELDGHPGRRVAADSGKARSVEDDGPVLVRSQKRGQRFCRPPAAPPGGLNGKIQGALDIAGHKLPVLAGVHQRERYEVLAGSAPPVPG